MPMSLPLTSKISPSSTRKRTYNTLRAKFGNGYGQSAPNGINDVQDTWTVSYELLTQAERDTLMAALDTVKGWDYFTWVAPGEVASKKWEVKGSDGITESTEGLYWNVSFTLEQRY